MISDLQKKAAAQSDPPAERQFICLSVISDLL